MEAGKANWLLYASKFLCNGCIGVNAVMESYSRLKQRMDEIFWIGDSSHKL